MSEDLLRFLALISALPEGGDARLAALLHPGELTIARAPGRLDVMGGIGDYSGSLTLELPLAEATFAAVQRSPLPSVRIASVSLGAQLSPRYTEFPLGEIRTHAADYPSARAYFARQPEAGWPSYIAGSLAALQKDCGVTLEHGLNVLIASSVPEGMGVSSSAAVEVATLKALAELHGVSLPSFELALACQRVENLVVGAPCGVMDQMTSSAGLEGQLLELLCQPASIQGCSPLPGELAVWGIDSGVRHQVSGADYTEVRVAAFMGYRIVAERAGLEVQPAPGGRVAVEDGQFGGYLANVGPERFEREFREALPELMTGAQFLERYTGITDPVTRVRPEKSYRVRAASTHPIYEHRRAGEYRALLRGGGAARSPERLGELMYEAHRSYGDCGLGSTGTDLIVQMVRELGPARGFYGAKITGGGSGGTVAVLTRAGAGPEVHELAERYAARTGHRPHIFQGSSPGASAFGVRRARAASPRDWRLTEG